MQGSQTAALRSSRRRNHSKRRTRGRHAYGADNGRGAGAHTPDLRKGDPLDVAHDPLLTGTRRSGSPRLQPLMLGSYVSLHAAAALSSPENS